MVETLERRWGVRVRRKFRLGDIPPQHLWIATMSKERTRPFIPPQGEAAEPVVMVRVNAGVWQACCPFCASAQHAAEGGWFYCGGCQNEATGHTLIPQVWPEPKLRQAVEAQLGERPAKQWRHWEPGETIADLKRQDNDPDALQIKAILKAAADG